MKWKTSAIACENDANGCNGDWWHAKLINEMSTRDRRKTNGKWDSKFKIVNER
jgi:hypothetical protein